MPAGDGWLHELKHDAFRIIAHKDGERVHLWSRNGRDRTSDFVAIADVVRGLPASRIVLDGEAIAHCLEGLPHFNRLLSGDGQASACLYPFDLIWLEAQDLRGVELLSYCTEAHWPKGTCTAARRVIRPSALGGSGDAGALRARVGMLPSQRARAQSLPECGRHVVHGASQTPEGPHTLPARDYSPGT